MPVETSRAELLSDVFTNIFEDFGTNTWRQVTKYRYLDNDGNDLGDKFYGQICEIGDGDIEEYHDVNKKTITLGISRIVGGHIPINETIKSSIALANSTNDAGIIDAIGKLNDEEANLLLISMSYGMHDEWDCSIEHFFSLFGSAEFRIAAK